MNVLIICDNRELLKRIYPCFYDEQEYKVYMVRFSQSAVEEFVKWKPMVVIIDEDTVIPYQVILSQFDDLHFAYQAVVFSSIDSKCEYEEGRYYFPKNNFVKEEVLEYIQELVYRKNMEEKRLDAETVESELPFNNILKRDIYTLFAIQYMEGSDKITLTSRVKKIEQIMQIFGKSDILYVDEKTIILAISKGQMQTSFQAGQISEALLRKCGKDCVIYIYNNVLWNQLSKAYGNLENDLTYSYFFKGQVVYENDIKRNQSSVEVADINLGLANILECIFEQKNKKLESRLRELLFHEISQKLDYNGIRYIRRMTVVLEHLCCSIIRRPIESNMATCVSLIDEYEVLLERFNNLMKDMDGTCASAIVRSGILYIMRHFEEDITLDSVAEELGVTKAYLSRVFRQETAITFLEFLQILRLQEAKHYILNTDMMISEVAGRVGYGDTHYFSRVFKKKVQYSPEAYKKLVKEGGHENVI